MATTTERPSAAELKEAKAGRVREEQAALEAARAAASSENDAAAEPFQQEDDGQTFMFEQGRKVTLGTLIARGVRVEYEIKLGGKAVKGKGEMGLIGFDSPEILLVVPGRAGKVEIDPTYDADGTIDKVTVRAHIKPQMVYDASTEAGQAALRGE